MKHDFPSPEAKNSLLSGLHKARMALTKPKTKDGEGVETITANCIKRSMLKPAIKFHVEYSMSLYFVLRNCSTWKKFFLSTIHVEHGKV